MGVSQLKRKGSKGPRGDRSIRELWGIKLFISFRDHFDKLAHRKSRASYTAGAVHREG